MKNVVFITMASHTRNMSNFNHFQRVRFLSQNPNVKLTILAQKKADFSDSASSETQIIRAERPGIAGLLLLCFWALFHGKKILDVSPKGAVILTEPSLVNIMGPLFKLFWGAKWAVDVWDIPIRDVRVKGLVKKIIFWIKKRLVRFAFRFADLFILSIRPDFEFRFFRVPESKIKCFPNAIVMDPNRPESIDIKPRGGDPFSIIYIRSVYTPIMGLDTLAAAYQEFHQKAPNSKLTIVGQIPGNVEEQVKELRDLDSVTFYPSVPYDELQKMIRQTTAMVIPFRKVSDLEQTHPIKTFEAMLNGSALVVPNLAGICALVREGETGIVYEADSVQGLTNALLQLYNDDLLRVKLAVNAYQTVGDYDAVKKNESIAGLLNNL